MVGLFTFDAPLYCDRNGVYCNTTVTNEMLDRYFIVVDRLILMMQIVHIQETFIERHLRPLELGDKIEIVEMPNMNTPKNYIFHGRFNTIIKEQVRRCDLFFLRIPSIISNLVAKECIRQRKDYLVEVGGCAWDSYWNHGLLGKIVAPSMFLSQKRTVKGATYASYVTEKWLQRRYPTNGESIVASNVYLNHFDSDNIEKRIKDYAERHERVYRLGTIASVDVRYKGQEFIIKAMGRLKREGIILDYDLVGAGDPTFLSSIAKKCEVYENVHFMGVKLHEEIWTWLDTIDIYAQPSKQEGLPRAVIEAMNRGCMAIGSDVAGIPELLEHDMTFHRDCVPQICSVIKKIIKENNNERRIRRNFKESQKFEVGILNERRNNLFLKYKELVKYKDENR